MNKKKSRTVSGARILTC